MKKVLLGIVALVVIVLLVPLFLKSGYAVTREIQVNKPKEEVFDYIKLLKNQDLYSKWMQMDPSAKKTYTGTDGTVGFVAAWESQNPDVGKGEQEIIKIEGNRIDYELRFLEPMSAKAPAFMSVEEKDGGSLVKWGIEGEIAYPFNVMLTMFDMEGDMGKDLDVGLQNLKKILEE